MKEKSANWLTIRSSSEGGSKKTTNSLSASASIRLDHWLDTHEHVARKIIIPAAAIREVRDKLDQANITERVLFPGLDGLSSWLTRYYRPKQD